eukprot:COSAG01_NODE_1460_length_10242_cov_285.193631_9_plen_67_part_01
MCWRWQVDLLGQLTGLHSLTLHGNPLETKGDGSSSVQQKRPRRGAASVASFVAAVVTEIYLCNVCSC